MVQESLNLDSIKGQNGPENLNLGKIKGQNGPGV